MNKRTLDELDRRIVEWLYKDARTSNRKIATALHVAEGTVRARIKRMQQRGQIHITAINNVDQLHHSVLAYLWINVEFGHQTTDAVRKLSQLAEMSFVSALLGRADILAIALLQSRLQLVDFVQTKVNSLSGVRCTDYSLSADLIKHDFRISRIIV